MKFRYTYKTSKEICLFLIFMIFFVPKSHSQDELRSYQINNKMRNWESTRTDSANIKYHGYIEIRSLIYDSIAFDTYDFEKKQYLDSCWATIRNDTIVINGIYSGEFFLGMFFLKDSFIAKLMTFEIISYKRPDTLIQFERIIPCKEQSLTLASKPDLKIGYVIKGIVEFASEDYWYIKKEIDKKYRIELRIHFIAEIKEN